MEDWESLRREGKTYIWTALKLQDYVHGMDHIPAEEKFGLFSKLDTNFRGEREWCPYRGPLEFQRLWEKLFRDHMETGPKLPSVIMLSLGIEMCLKSIFLRETSKPADESLDIFRRGVRHDLYKMFGKLEDETKNSLRKAFKTLLQRAKANAPKGEQGICNKETLDGILQKNSLEFEEGRYLYEKMYYLYPHPFWIYKAAALAIVDYITNAD